MYFDDHPPPHFHARYGSFKAKFSINPPALMTGDLPPAQLRLVLEWTSLHREELEANFAAVMARRPTSKIDPLT